MAQYTYLFINFLIISIPALFSFKSPVYFFSQWRAVLKAILIISTPFIMWDIGVTGLHWNFVGTYITGIKIIGLPIEEILFFITVPYSCLFIYEVIRHYLPIKQIQLINELWLVAAAVCLTGAIAATGGYTTIVLLVSSTLFLYYFLVEPQIISTNHYWWYLFFGFIAFGIFNTWLTLLPVVIYNPSSITGIRLGTIPLEDVLYNAVLLSGYLLVFSQYRKQS